MAQARTARVEELAVLATVPAALEGIALARDGSIYVTNDVDRTVFVLGPRGRLVRRWTLPAHPQTLAVTTRGDIVVTAHANPPDFSVMARPGGRFDLTNLGTMVLVLTEDGTVQRTFPGPADSFFNGIARVTDSVFIIADSTGGSLWKLDLRQNSLERWLSGGVVESAAGRGNNGGANGIKVHDGWVYFTSRGAMWRVKVGADQRADGEPVRFAAVNGDDFDIAADGSVFIVSGGKLVKISPEGETTDAVADLGVGCPSVHITSDQRAVLAVTRGSFPDLPPPILPSRLLRVSLTP